MGRKSTKLAPVTPAEWDQLYQYFLENQDDPHCFDKIFARIAPYIEMCKKSFKVNPQYWDEWDTHLRENIWRAFHDFKDDRGSRFSTWIYRLSSQSAWAFIRDKCKEIDREMNSCDISTSYKLAIDSMDPEMETIQKENGDETNRQLNLVLRAILKGPVEYDVYVRKYGLFGYDAMSVEEIAEELSLTPKTVEQLITRNTNCISNFKKFLKTSKNMSQADIIKKYKEKCQKFV